MATDSDELWPDIGILANTTATEESEVEQDSLINTYRALKNKYRDYDTKHAIIRMQALRRAVRELNNRGFPLGLELLGSINFGIVEPNSDADLIILHRCEEHKYDGECLPHCQKLKYEKEEIVKQLNRSLPHEKFSVEFLDCVNLSYIEHLLKQEEVPLESPVFRFMFYRVMGRPVNRPLFIDLYVELTDHKEIWPAFNKWATLALKAYLNTTDHRYSFSKYNERLLNRRLHLPDEIQNELKKYLDSV